MHSSSVQNRARLVGRELSHPPGASRHYRTVLLPVVASSVYYDSRGCGLMEVKTSRPLSEDEPGEASRRINGVS